MSKSLPAAEKGSTTRRDFLKTSTQAVAAGRLSEQQVDESVLRVGRFKNAVPC